MVGTSSWSGFGLQGRHETAHLETDFHTGTMKSAPMPELSVCCRIGGSDRDGYDKKPKGVRDSE